MGSCVRAPSHCGYFKHFYLYFLTCGMPVYSSIYDQQYFQNRQGQTSTEFFDSFLNTDSMLQEDKNELSEEELKQETPTVSASTLLDFFNQLQGQVGPHISSEQIKAEPGIEPGPE